MTIRSLLCNALSIATLLAIEGCSLLQKNQAGSTPETAIVLDTMDFAIDAEKLLPYQPAEKRVIDILHLELDLRFDWSTEEVFGTAKNTLTPYFDAVDTIQLDARGFEIVSVELETADTVIEPQYVYDGKALSIIPDDRLTVEDTVTITVQYIARPTKLEHVSGDAITSNQGLYFINPRGEIEGKPRQIWSQGETEFNSGWFPCVDQPNEKFTQEVFITADSSLHTVSNGKLIYSTINEDGTHTDYWKQDIPHSTYLVMIAVGEFALVKDEWNGMPVWYYLDEEFEPYAMNIFGNTPEMLTFYSELLDFKYPWDKYHQIVVKDFVSGAMENTSAVIHGDFVQLTPRELLDESHEDVIAHELFHHWFGNVVTSESWAQITMNEGFATYGEYLWKEYKYGEQSARHHLQNDKQAYLSQASTHAKTLIRYRYQSADEVFDSHSYQKGGLILHMLRYEAGDEAFFKALQTYLKDNAYTNVEDDNLRLAFEEVTGEDWRWFFDTWYYQKGHPQVNANYEVDTGKSELVVRLEQTQTDWPVFKFHADLVLETATQGLDTVRIWIDQSIEEFRIPVEGNVLWYALDPNRNVLWELNETKGNEVWLSQLTNGKGYHSTISAINNLNADNQAIMEAFQYELGEIAVDVESAYSQTRYTAIEGLFKAPLADTTASLLWLERAFDQDPNSDVRSIALFALDSLNHGKPLNKALFNKAVNDSSFLVIRTALSILLSHDPCAAAEFLVELDEEEKKSMMVWASRIHAACADDDALVFFINSGRDLEGFEQFLFNSDFLSYAKQAHSVEAYNALIEKVAPAALDEDSWWARLSAMQAIEATIAFYAEVITELEAKSETTDDELEQLATLRNKKAGLSALLEEAQEINASDDRFMMD